ncbi:Inositol-1-monophosphatase [Rhodobacteraceae bacterium THAF1]|uniref:inositol monophosphatase family protein n=1 Tax=Palleronia sp. THAF1 TaxID=2587842 RepID=UPI000F3B0C86|nr:inositol monophosphatase family protein [Palleronia sp. THAF1]QFU09034.1 Inositol-1-monophosphatase [Palleronia sp. THAF1]VDC24199.1 Inositol-1-monophosphatase [Rhodobacteraceae bacterium THAF1]
MQGSANLTIMIKAARAAARKLIRDFAEVENLQVSVKGSSDFVTRAEAMSDEVIREMLQRERPNYGWQSKSNEVEGKDPTRRWIVDPLADSVNFAHGLPHWSLSIALEHKGEIVAGVIYDPAKDELFWAEKGAGAFMNERRLRVSGRGRMVDCLFAAGMPASKSAIPLSVRDIGRLMPGCAGVREWGSPALALCYVAAGRFDGYFERGIRPWHVAAGMVIVREAGGFVEPLGEQPILEGRTIVAANGDIFETFAKELRKS